jgi:hypothetical protein
MTMRLVFVNLGSTDGVPRLGIFHIIEYYVQLRSAEERASGTYRALAALSAERRQLLLATVVRRN